MLIVEVVPLPPLPPGDYSRSAESARWLQQRRDRGERVIICGRDTTVDVPFWTAPPGYCRWCGQDLGRRLKSGKPDGRTKWHPECVSVYRTLSDPSWQRHTAWANTGGRCVDCGPASLPLPPPIYDRTRYPLGPWGVGEWEADHVIELADGGRHEAENLVLRCVPHHRAKSAASVSRRAAARRSAK